MSDFSYWEKRGETYGGLDDVKSKRTAYKIVDFIKPLGLNSKSWILDGGCGKGDITKIIRDNFRHSNVVGIDLSQNMINGAISKEADGLKFFCREYFEFIHEITTFFDLILFSLFVHHLTDGRDQKAIDHAYKALNPKGHIVIAEAIPPSDDVLDYYKQIFEMKEDRNCYTLKDLLRLVRNAGFEEVKFHTYSFDIRLLSWLDDNTLTDLKKNLLYSMHIVATKGFKDAYAMESLGEGDYRLRCKMALVSGVKA